MLSNAFLHLLAEICDRRRLHAAQAYRQHWDSETMHADRAPRILSTLDTWAHIGIWATRVDTVALPRFGRATLPSRVASALVEAASGVRLWVRSRKYDAVVTDARPHVAVFGALCRLGWGGPRRHLMFECLWRRPERRLLAWMKRLQVRASVTSRTRAIVYARRESEAFSNCFHVPRERFVFIPYHTTLMEFTRPTNGPPLSEPYVFAGGDSERDYQTLCAAVRGLELPVVVACRDRSPFATFPVPPNVRVITTTPEDFLRWMYHAHINIVPLRGGTLRSAGQQTFLNAMAFGTAVIVTDVEGGRDYIRDGENGILVAPGDPVALRAALDRLLREPGLRRQIAAEARSAADTYSTERILSTCLDFLGSTEFEDPRVTACLPDAGPTIQSDSI